MQTSPNDESNFLKKKSILNTLLQGFLVLLPLTVILIVLTIIFKFILNILSPVSSLIDPGSDEPAWVMHVISLLVLLGFVFFVGLVIQNHIGQSYFRSFEARYLKRIPLYSVIYELIHQFSGLKKLPFSEVVMIDPYKTGVLMTGFITEYINDELYTVFVPTAPNPTNGNIFHVPKSMIIFLKVTPQDAMRTVVGMGTGTASIYLKNKNERERKKNLNHTEKNVPVNHV